MLRSIYDWVISLASHRRATSALATIAFVESSIFPIPPDALLIPMALAHPERAWRFAFIATISSVLGGILGYAIGYLLYDTIGQAIIGFYGAGDKFNGFITRYNENGAAIVFFAGLTPFPYKVITIASGVAQMSLPIFMAASIISRGLRFYLICGLLWYFGEPVRHFIEKYLGWLTLIGGILLVGGFVAIKYIM